MRFSALLTALPPELAPRETRVADDPPIRNLCIDSRRVAPGDLFVALPGAETDGHDHVPEALSLGASALLLERSVPDLPDDVARAFAPDTRRALAPLAAQFFGHPSRRLELVGVTGTNGKTSTTYLVESILARAGRSVGLIGTVEMRYAEVHQRTLNTTPESIDLQRTLRAMLDRGIEAVAMEVSSHGVALGRIDGCRFAIVACTNVTQDHLDFHRTMEEYLDTKLQFFRRFLAPDGLAVVNADDASAAAFEAAAKEAGARLLRVSRRAGQGDVTLCEADVQLGGTRARLQLPDGSLETRLPLLGDFNLENMLVATAVAVGLGVPREDIAAGLSSCPQVPGRVERVGPESPGLPTVLVDYAHTPDAVEKLLAAVRPLAQGRLIALFGCGGDRDRGKRRLMAEAVARYGDRVIATSDNPRSEDPLRILADVEKGLRDLQKVEAAQLDGTSRSYASLPDRREAIELAVRIARPEDTVVLAGKGHEDYQIVGRERLPFDDRVEARRALERRQEGR
ncbi:MAG: UDP-N-acetylmuramoyl-L-alanyl-D-glutamate--2,6-diaminopimelate ligase [Myxococcota bacterium]